MRRGVAGRDEAWRGEAGRAMGGASEFSPDGPGLAGNPTEARKTRRRDGARGEAVRGAGEMGVRGRGGGGKMAHAMLLWSRQCNTESVVQHSNYSMVS